MPGLGRLETLTTVMGSFHGRVLKARLGAEGIVVVLKGVSDGPYPLQGAVDVLVPAEQLGLAREILLADAVEDALVGSSFEELAPVREPEAAGAHRGTRVHGVGAALVVVVVITLVIVAYMAASH